MSTEHEASDARAARQRENPPTVDAPGIDQQRHASAYHEAGHAVIALWNGWRISPEGVEIDARQYTGTRCTVWQRDLEGPWVLVCLAGWLSEHKWHKRGPSFNLDIEGIIYDVQFGHDEEAEGDEGDVIRHLLRLRPDASDDDLIARYRHYEQKTIALLDEPFIWFAIERFAAELLKRGKVGTRRAATLWRRLNEEFFAGNGAERDGGDGQ